MGMLFAMSLTLCWSTFAFAQSTGTVRFVDDDSLLFADGMSWDTAYRYLQDALANAEGVTEIRVAQGTYKPDEDAMGNVTNNDREEAFELVNGVALRGGFAGVGAPNPDERDIALYETILSGKLGGPRSYHVVRGSGLDATTVLDGFTITAGRATGTCCVHDRGGGMYLSASSPMVVSCTFRANTAKTVAGAVWLADGASTFIDCVFEDNTVFPGNSGGAIHNVFGSDLTLIRCVFHHNTLGTGSTGGGAIFVGGNPQGNPVSTVTAIGCVFTDNNGSAGGAVLNNGISTFTNCVFAGNSALRQGFGPKTGQGGAIANIGQLTVTNCTIFANSAALAGGGIYTGRDSPNSNLDSMTIVNNCILWGNTAPSDTEAAQIVVANSELEINYSSVEGWTGQLGGAGNIGEDPLFVDPLGFDGAAGTPDDNLRLLPGSPCIDAGDNTAVPAGITTDLDGNPRFVDDPATPDTGCGGCPIVEMGAYEFQEGTTECPCPADVNGDGVVNVLDLIELLISFGPFENCSADLNDDGFVDVLDLIALLLNFGPCPGTPCVWDVNGDGVVDQSDLQQVVDNFGPCDGCPEDINGDGVVNGQDAAAVATHFGPCP